MAEANGAETPHTGTAPEPENTSLDPSQTRHPEPEQARRPKITRGEEGLTEWERRTDKPLFYCLAPVPYCLRRAYCEHTH